MTKQDKKIKEKQFRSQSGAAPVGSFEMLRKWKLADEGCGQTGIVE
jgi:hypothetical protein